ncbi:MAG: dehydrogenase [Blastopirellula sp.]|nr:MAG: dehydrogenase [Blastopirellula sp.]
MSKLVNRRNFLKSSVASAAVISAPAILSAKSPNETVRVAGVGVGGKGWTDINGAAKHADVVAYCDVDTGKNRKGGYGNAAETWESATGYTDFRKMIEKEHKNLDGITISTPDHMHAPVTMMALKHGLAVYTQKPLTRTISEARALTLAAADAGVSTQMGNQHHSGAGYRTLVEIVRSGKIGKIKTAHSWSNRPVWPQGMERPAGSDPIPKTLDWNLWLGVAQERPYKKDVYHAFKWRGWFDFGAGALGDMGCHIIDPVVWSLDLGPAKSVSYVGPKPMAETFPKSEVLKYKFPGTQYTAGKQFTLTWHDGGKLPPLKGSHVPSNVDVPPNGVMFIGEKGTILCAHGRTPVVYAEDQSVMTGLPTVAGLDHYGVWVDGIKSGKTPNSSFAYAGPMTETVLLGVVAARMGAGELKWDSKKMAFTNSDKANQFVHHQYRSGWEIKGL